MKIATFAVLLTLLLLPSYARADVFVFSLDEEAAVNGQPNYQQPARPQFVQRAQPVAPQPSVYVYPCGQPMAAQQPAPYPQPIARGMIAREDRIVYFKFGQSRLSNEAQTKLNSLAIRPVSTASATNTYIVGYTDRIGSASANEKLSRKRADNVRNYLIKRGLIDQNVIETRWLGKSQASMRCSKHLPRAKLLRCLQPDRKVEVNIDYRPLAWQTR